MIKIFIHRTSILYIFMHFTVHILLFLMNNYCPMSKCHEKIYYLVYNLEIAAVQALLT